MGALAARGEARLLPAQGPPAPAWGCILVGPRSSPPPPFLTQHTVPLPHLGGARCCGLRRGAVEGGEACTIGAHTRLSDVPDCSASGVVVAHCMCCTADTK